jgi:hypothetical protein
MEQERFRGALWCLSLLLLICSAVWFLIGIVLYTPDVPFWDEWYSVSVGALDQHLNTSWLFDRFGDHLIVITKLIEWLFYITTGWNTHIASIFNYIQYCALIALLFWILAPLGRSIPVFPIFFIPMFSGFMSMSVGWAFVGCFHQMEIFGLLAIYVGFIRNQTWVTALAFTFFCLASAFSFSPPLALGIFGVYFVRAVLTKREQTTRRTIFHIVLPTVLFSLGIYVMLLGQPHVYKTLMPNDLRFIRLFSTIVSVSLTGIFPTGLYYAHITLFVALLFGFALLAAWREGLMRNRHFSGSGRALRRSRLGFAGNTGLG